MTFTIDYFTFTSNETFTPAAPRSRSRSRPACCIHVDPGHHWR